jgi:UDP-2,3-diacylglucosamine hydrolase
MYLSDIEIKEGAFVVSDAHYSHLRPHFLSFIKAIHSKKLNPTQLIFLGDIFDILFYEVPHSQKINKEALKLINEISKDIEVVYLEGNHDFNLKNIFPHAKVFPIAKQPLLCSVGTKKLFLAHGDFGSVLSYRIYTAFIRNPLVLYLLRSIDNLLNHAFIKKLDIYLSKKEDCKEFTGFRKFVKQRLDDKFECDYFIEGHFHQNETFVFDTFTYINVGAFACGQNYFIVNSLDDKLLKEVVFDE